MAVSQYPVIKGVMMIQAFGFCAAAQRWSFALVLRG